MIASGRKCAGSIPSLSFGPAEGVDCLAAHHVDEADSRVGTTTSDRSGLPERALPDLLTNGRKGGVAGGLRTDWRLEPSLEL